MAGEAEERSWSDGLLQLGRLARHAPRDLTALVAVLGGFLYALIALAYEHFYRVLGIDPKDVGITPTTIITRTAVALAVFVAIGVGAYCGCFAVLATVLRGSTPGMTALAALSAVAVLGPVLVAKTIAPVLLSGRLALITGSLIAVLLGACLWTMWILRRTRLVRQRVALAAIWLAVLTLFFFAGVDFALVRADGLARSVLEGTPVPPLGETFVFDVHADPVCVRHDDPAGSPSGPTYRLYLGEANGWLALYDPVHQVTERLSNQGRSLTFLMQSGPQSCR